MTFGPQRRWEWQRSLDHDPMEFFVTVIVSVVATCICISAVSVMILFLRIVWEAILQ